MRECGPENFVIRPLELIHGTKEEAAFSEQWWAKFLGAGLNMLTAGVTVLCGGKESTLELTARSTTKITANMC